MPSRLPDSRAPSIKVRLALLSGLMFGLGVVLTYALLDFSFAGILQAHVDDFLLSELHEFAAIHADGQMAGLREEVLREEAAGGETGVLIRIADIGGNTLLASDLSSWPHDAYAIPKEALKPYRGVRFDTVRIPDRDVRLRRVMGGIGASLFLVLGYPLDENARLLSALRARAAWILSTMLVLSVLVAWGAASRAMKGVEAVTQTATRIAAGDLALRVPSKGYGAEIDQLAEAFNQMLDRISALMNEIKAITDNIAHELRSPIARIRGNAEVTLLSDAPLGGFQEMTAGIIEDCDHLLALANAMLDISEIEAGVAALARRPVDVAQMARDACELFQPAAEDRGIAIQVEAAQAVEIPGDSRKLHQALANLLDNAVKYTPRGGTVTVTVTERGDSVNLVVSDTGAGIAEEDLPHIFERFYRADRSRSEPGNGLGLNLVHAVATAHGGRVAVDSRPGEGAVFTLVLPKR